METWFTLFGTLRGNGEYVHLASCLTEEPPPQPVPEPEGGLSPASVTLELLVAGSKPGGRYSLPVVSLCMQPMAGVKVKQPTEWLIGGHVPFGDESTGVRLLVGGEAVFQREVADPPKIEWITPPTPAGGAQTVAWRADESNKRWLVHRLSVTNDQERWLPVTTWTAKASAEIDLDTLPGGRLTFKVTATDGLNTAEQVTTIERPPGLCIPFILMPREGAKLPPKLPITLAGGARHLDDGREETELFWSSSLDGDLGDGPMIDARLSPGKHVITLAAGAGKPRASTRVRLSVSK